MGTPRPENFTEALYDFAGLRIAHLICQSVSTNSKILDIGSGWGKFRWLLPQYEMDAIEIWAPYVRENKLKDHYGEVYVIDAVDFEYPYRYGAVILGDVLEHMSVENAKKVIHDACGNADLVAVAVPFRMPQHAEDGNPYEEHVQDDLDERIMLQRYPELSLYRFNGHKAIYIYRGHSDS